MIRILIADDSAFMRKVLSDLFARQPDFDVVGVAYNGKDAIAKTVKLRPALLTLDINMSIMDGLTALKRHLLKVLYFVVVYLVVEIYLVMISLKKPII